MALLLAEVGGSDTLHKVQDIEQRIAEELRENQRADHDAKFACIQPFYLRRVWDETLLQQQVAASKTAWGPWGTSNTHGWRSTSRFKLALTPPVMSHCNKRTRLRSTGEASSSR